MVSFGSSAINLRPLVLLAALIGLVLLLPGALSLDADVSVSTPLVEGGAVDAVDAPEPLASTAELDKVNADPDAVVQTARSTVDRAHATASGAVPTGLPTDALVDPSAAEAVTGDKTSGRATTQDSDAEVWAADTAKSGAMAVGGAGLFGLLFWAKNALGLAGSRFLLAPLFSRIDKNDMLENEGRELLYNLVQGNPGISLSELSERSGLGWGTTVYHLGRLEQAGFVSSMRQGQTRHFFEKGNAVAAQKNAIAVLKNQTAGDMARFLMAQPGATQSAIGQALGIKAPVVTKYVKRLAGEGLVDVAPSGRSKVITPTSELTAAMMHLDTPAGTIGVAQPQLANAPMASAA